MVIPELVFMAALFLLGFVVLILLSEDESLAEMSERLHVNRLADQSKKRKPQGMRPRCRYIRAGIQKK